MPELDDLERCFSGAIPAVIATRAADGAPNVTYLSRVYRVDDERVALSNQFFSKTARNLADHPRASALVVDPSTYDEFRLTLAYERTDRRGPVFERLRKEIDDLAAMMHMQSVFRLRAADIYRVLDIEHLPPNEGAPTRGGAATATHAPTDIAEVAELVGRFGRCTDLDDLVSVTIDGIAEVLGHEHVSILLVDSEDDGRLFTIASRGYDRQGVGSDVALGEGVVGVAAQRCETIMVGSVNQMAKYANRVRASFEASGDVGPGQEVPLPSLEDAASVVAVPARSVGELVGVVVAEHSAPAAYAAADVSTLEVVASHFAAAVSAIGRITITSGSERQQHQDAPPADDSQAVHVRFFEVDGSVFFDGDYVIKGVAGRVLWTLLQQYVDQGRLDFSNRELRLEPSLGLPSFRDNLDARLIMLKRRLDERYAPVRIEKTGRGRFALTVEASVRLDES